ncbi:MAG TPA: DUF3667 domain-containing protein [Longimicrobium sp.]|jgi:hypothetical protein
MTEQAPPRSWSLPRWRRPAPSPGACANCGTPVSDHYCPHCGQRNAPRVVSLRRLLAEAVEDQFSLNAALPRTLRALFLRPGHLTREYVTGRIARYIPPFRLYLIASLLFFIGLSFVTDPDAMIREMETRVPADSLRVLQTDPSAPPRYENVNFSFDTVKANRLWKPLARRLQQQADRINSLTPRESIRLLSSGMLRTAPKVVFALLPVFAAMLWLLYARRRRMYVEHFVFSLHVHAFAFLLFAAALLLRSRVLGGLFFAWVLVYLFLAMKKNYGQGYLLTGLKYLALLSVYFFVVIFGVAATLLLTVLTV